MLLLLQKTLKLVLSSKLQGPFWKLRYFLKGKNIGKERTSIITPICASLVPGIKNSHQTGSAQYILAAVPFVLDMPLICCGPEGLIKRQQHQFYASCRFFHPGSILCCTLKATSRSLYVPQVGGLQHKPESDPQRPLHYLSSVICVGFNGCCLAKILPAV